MQNIFIIMGKSGSGKDTILRKLEKLYKEDYTKLLIHTTRPKRENEVSGIDYYFDSKKDMCDNKSFLSLKTYTVFYRGKKEVWSYYIPLSDKEIIHNSKKPIIINGNRFIYKDLSERFGFNVIPILISIDEDTRFKRLLDREFKMKKPNYKELCRRYLADSDDEEFYRKIESYNGFIIENKDVDNSANLLYDIITKLR